MYAYIEKSSQIVTLNISQQFYKGDIYIELISPDYLNKLDPLTIAKVDVQMMQQCNDGEIMMISAIT